jgi:hypothetical protein
VPQNVLRKLVDILRERVAAAAEQRESARSVDQVDRAAGARAERDVAGQLVEPVRGRAPRGEHESDRIARDVGVDVDRSGRLLKLPEQLGRDDLLDLRLARERTLHDRQLVGVIGVVDEHLEHEAVDLRLGKRVGALRLDRVLRGEDEERLRDGVGLPADRDLVLLHHLEQRRLHLRRGAIDLVGEQEVAEDRPELRVERAVPLPVDPRAYEIRGDEVGRELHAVERAAEDLGECLDRESLGESGNALDQEMSAGEEPYEHALEHLLLADDDALHLEQGALELVLQVRFAGECDRAIDLGHARILLPERFKGQSTSGVLTPD